MTDSDDPVPVNRDSPKMTTLPDPELSNLQEILETLSSANTLHEKDKLSTFITIEVSYYYTALLHETSLNTNRITLTNCSHYLKQLKIWKI